MKKTILSLLIVTICLQAAPSVGKWSSWKRYNKNNPNIYYRHITYKQGYYDSICNMQVQIKNNSSVDIKVSFGVDYKGSNSSKYIRSKGIETFEWLNLPKNSIKSWATKIDLKRVNNQGYYGKNLYTSRCLDGTALNLRLKHYKTDAVKYTMEVK